MNTTTSTKPNPYMIALGFASAIVIAVMIGALIVSFSSRTDENIMDEAIEETWSEMTASEQADVCTAYLLLGPDTFRDLMRDGLSSNDQGFTGDQFELFVDTFTQNVGAECL